jgi:hypothetical protein
MAKAKGPTQLRGNLQSLTFRVRNGQQEVYPRPGDYDFSKAGPAYHWNKREFAAAARIAQAIHRSISRKRFDELGPIFCPYPQNSITAALKLGADLHRKPCRKLRRKPYFHYATTFTFKDAAAALQGLDLSKKTAPTQYVEMIPLGPRHSPTHLQINGLERAAEAVPCEGNARLEFRIHIRQSRIKELQYCEDQEKWLPRSEETVVADGFAKQYAAPRKHRTSQIQTPQTTTHASSSLSSLAASLSPLAASPPPLAPQSTTQPRTSHATPPTDWIPVQFIPAQGITLPIPQWEETDRYLTVVLIEWREIRTVGHKVHTKHDMGIVRIATLHGPAEAYQDTTPNHHHGPKNHPWNLAADEPLPTDKWQQMDPEAYLAAALEKLKETSP